jgi:hypothetical protein
VIVASTTPALATRWASSFGSPSTNGARRASAARLPALAHHGVEPLIRVGESLRGSVAPFDRGRTLSGHRQHAWAWIQAGDEAARPYTRRGLPREDPRATRDIKHMVASLDPSQRRYARGPFAKQRRHAEFVVRLRRSDLSRRQVGIAHSAPLLTRARRRRVSVANEGTLTEQRQAMAAGRAHRQARDMTMLAI